MADRDNNYWLAVQILIITAGFIAGTASLDMLPSSHHRIRSHPSLHADHVLLVSLRGVAALISEYHRDCH